MIETSVQKSAESERTPLQEVPPTSSPWLKQDYIAITIYLLVKFGEAVETFLPGVINQVVSCELGVTHFQEGLLGIALYFSQCFSKLGTGFTGRYVPDNQ